MNIEEIAFGNACKAISYDPDSNPSSFAEEQMTISHSVPKTKTNHNNNLDCLTPILSQSVAFSSLIDHRIFKFHLFGFAFFINYVPNDFQTG